MRVDFGFVFMHSDACHCTQALSQWYVSRACFYHSVHHISVTAQADAIAWMLAHCRLRDGLLKSNGHGVRPKQKSGCGSRQRKKPKGRGKKKRQQKGGAEGLKRRRLRGSGMMKSRRQLLQQLLLLRLQVSCAAV